MVAVRVADAVDLCNMTYSVQGKYEIGKTLGEGTFGKVKYAVNTETGEKVRYPAFCVSRTLPETPSPDLIQVAIKILDKEKIQKQNMGSQIKKEVCQWSHFRTLRCERKDSLAADLYHESRQA